jgi:hypothetical protein
MMSAIVRCPPRSIEIIGAQPSREERHMGEGLGRAVAGLLRALLAPVKGLIGLIVGLVRGLVTGLAKIFT